jgi:hypothetical protein
MPFWPHLPRKLSIIRALHPAQRPTIGFRMMMSRSCDF